MNTSTSNSYLSTLIVSNTHLRRQQIYPKSHCLSNLTGIDNNAQLKTCKYNGIFMRMLMR